MGLLITVLGIILLCNECVDQDVLYDELRRMGLRVGENHPVFKDWEKELDKFVKELYIEKKKGDKIGKDNSKLYEYFIGPRSLKEIGKPTIYRWVCSAYNEKPDDAVLVTYENEEKEQQEGEESEEEDKEEEDS